MIMSTGSIEASPSPSPGSFPTTITLHNSFPKMGTLIPNRVFVGGISTSTTESELHQLFSEFGNVKQTKIIADRSGVSKGYGFVTFETEEEARRLQAASEDIVLKERKLNIAPAIKKQPNYTTGGGRGYEMGQPIVNGAVYYHNGIPYTYQNGVAMFIDPNALSGLLSPTGQKGGVPSSPYPLLYPGAGNPTMFLPSPAPTGHTSPLLQQQVSGQPSAAGGACTTAQQQHQQSAAQQLHLQTAAAQAQAAATASAAAVRDMAQSPVGCGGSQVHSNKQTQSNQAWRFASSTPAGTPGTPAGTPTASPYSLNQTLSIQAQNGQAGQAGFLPLDQAFQFVPSPFTQHPGLGLAALQHSGFLIPNRY
jgi:hypothetical protein